MIHVHDVTKRFGDLAAVDRLSVNFGQGITGLVGQNGAGKSTLFRVIAGIYKSDEGTVDIDGKPNLEPEGKADVFFLSDDPYAPHGANIEGVLDFYQGLFDIDAERFHALIAKFGLPLGKSIGTFSKGMKRQVFIALALSVNANHLLLDEAFDGLDPLVVDMIKNEIIDASTSGKTIVISSHNIFALQKLVDRFVVVANGRVSKEEEAEGMGAEFVKFQAAFPAPITEKDIEGLGFELVSFHVVGSVTHFVILGGKESAQTIKESLKPLFIEPVPLEPDEVVALEMLLAKKGGSDNA
ncbi:MAG: ABC transporter ATP-binding protein [Bacilli bacterium]|nr:ABC transporter ATP-binding protein [Bacilli bacterium]